VATNVAHPIFTDTDTTIAAGTNWEGANGGVKFTGERGIRSIKIILDTDTP
jgi:hypothetical protein